MKKGIRKNGKRNWPDGYFNLISHLNKAYIQINTAAGQNLGFFSLRSTFKKSLLEIYSPMAGNSFKEKLHIHINSIHYFFQKSIIPIIMEPSASSHREDIKKAKLKYQLCTAKGLH